MNSDCVIHYIVEFPVDFVQLIALTISNFVREYDDVGIRTISNHQVNNTDTHIESIISLPSLIVMKESIAGGGIVTCQMSALLRRKMLKGMMALKRTISLA
jgi:hypothetical protein